MRHLRLLQQVSEIARLGSVRKAAEAMHITPSALNRRIHHLELEIGSQIFERRSHGVKLTEPGKVFLKYAQNLVADGERLASHMKDLKNPGNATIRIVCSKSAAYDYVPAEMTAFRQEYADIRFKVSVLDQESALTALRSSEADLALIASHRVGPAFRILKATAQRLVATMACEHKLAQQPAVRLHECAHFPVVLPAGGLGARQMIDEASTQLGIRFNVIAESNSVDLLRTMIPHSNTISFELGVGEVYDTDIPGLVSLQVDDRDAPSATLTLFRLRDRPLSDAAEMFGRRLARQLE